MMVLGTILLAALFTVGLLFNVTGPLTDKVSAYVGDRWPRQHNLLGNIWCLFAAAITTAVAFIAAFLLTGQL